MKTWLALCLALLVVQAAATLRPRRDIELTGLAPPSDTFFWRYPPENETGEGKFFSRGMTVAPAEEQHNEKRVVVDEPVVVPFGRVQDKAPNGSTYRARRFVINGLDPNKVCPLFFACALCLLSFFLPSNRRSPRFFLLKNFLKLQK